MNIAPERMTAANYVLQFSIATMVTSIVSVPYNAAIIANEKMSAFCIYIHHRSFTEANACLASRVFPVDKLITYSALMFW